MIGRNGKSKWPIFTVEGGHQQSPTGTMLELMLFNIFLKCCEVVALEVWAVKWQSLLRILGCSGSES